MSMDGPRECLWMVPENVYGWSQRMSMDGPRECLWMVPENVCPKA
jgi:hypothetical protein